MSFIEYKLFFVYWTRKLQERFENDNLREKLITSLLDRNIFDIVNNLQEIQVRTEKNLFNERQKLIKQAKGTNKENS